MFNEDDADQIFYDVVNATLSHKIYNEKKLDEKSLEIAEKMKKEYSADYMAIGRALVADPDFIGKYYNEMRNPIKPCLAL